MSWNFVFGWMKDNWKFLSTILVVLASFAGVKLTFTPGSPGGKPEVIIVIPTDDGGFRVQDGQPQPVEAGEYLAAQIVLRVAITILERRAPQTPSEWDDRLLVVLKLFVTDRVAFERAERAAKGR